MQAIGIDIGSTSIKGAILDLDVGTVSDPVMRSFPSPIAGQPVGWVEIDPLSVCQVFDEVLKVLADQAREASRLIVSSQMGGLVLMDERTQPMTHYLSWRDQRTIALTDSRESLIQWVRNQWESNGQLDALGGELQPGSTSSLMAWLQKDNSLPRSAIPCCLGDYVIARLVGHPIPMHATQAIGLLDLRGNDWHRDALASIGLDIPKLPELSFDETSVGEVVVAGHRLEVFGSYGDQQCALRGAGLQREELSLNISTGSQVSRRSTDFRPGDYQTRKYFFGDYLDTVTHIPAGRSLNVLIDLLTELARAEGVQLRDPWGSIQRKVDEVVETDLEIDLAFFRSPVGERGSIEGITTDNLHIGNLFHAAYRAMADNYQRLASRFPDQDWKAVVLSGGLVQSAPRLLQLLEQRFAAPMRVSMSEETLLGLLDIARADLPG